MAESHQEHRLILEALVRSDLEGNFAHNPYHWAAAWAEFHPEEWRAWYWRGRAFKAAGQLMLAGKIMPGSWSKTPATRTLRFPGVG
jgi:hypothetical protein